MQCPDRRWDTFSLLSKGHHLCWNLSYSQILRNNLLHCVRIHIQFFCYYYPCNRPWRPIGLWDVKDSTKVCTLSTFASVLRVLAAHFLGPFAHLLALPWTVCAIKKHSISLRHIHDNPMSIGWRFNSTFTNLHAKLDIYRPLQILVVHFSANSIQRTRDASSTAWERAVHLVCSSCKRKLEHVQTRFSTWVCLTQHLSDTLRPLWELSCRTSCWEILL
jgi:hypothetical protein